MRDRALASTIAATFALSAAAQQYTPSDIGTLTDRSSLLAAINARGVAAGSSAVSGDPPGAPWVLPAVVFPVGDLRDLGVLGPDVPPAVFPKPESRAFGINGLAQVSGRSSQPGEAFQAFLWLPEPAYGLGAGMHALPELSDLGAQALCDQNLF